MIEEGLHTYIKCSKCGDTVRASRHTPEECKKNREDTTAKTGERFELH